MLAGLNACQFACVCTLCVARRMVRSRGPDSAVEAGVRCGIQAVGRVECGESARTHHVAGGPGGGVYGAGCTAQFSNTQEVIQSNPVANAQSHPAARAAKPAWRTWTGKGGRGDESVNPVRARFANACRYPVQAGVRCGGEATRVQ